MFEWQTNELVKQVTNLRETLEKVAMSEGTKAWHSAWLFELCESLGELENQKISRPKTREGSSDIFATDEVRKQKIGEIYDEN